jgi:hypothetical protein
MTVNFTNILQAAFSYKVLCAPFMCLQFRSVNFWQKELGAKAAHKMLVKLTSGLLYWVEVNGGGKHSSSL